MGERSDARTGLFFILIAVLGYSMLPVFTHYLGEGGMQPLDIAVWRYLFAAPVFWILMQSPAFARGAGDSTIAPKRLPRTPLFLMGILLAAAALAAFYGLRLIPAGTFVVIFYTYPAMVALLMLLFGERLSIWGWAAIGMTLVGIALTAPDFSAGLRGDNLSGVLLSLLNAFIVAIYFILNGRVLRGHNRLGLASAWTVTGTLFFLLLIVPFNGLTLPQGTTWLYLIGLATFSTVMPIFALTNGIVKAGATRASLFGTIEPLITALFAQWFIGQAMQPIQWLGGIIIIMSVVLLQLFGSIKTLDSTKSDDRLETKT